MAQEDRPYKWIQTWDRKRIIQEIESLTGKQHTELNTLDKKQLIILLAKCLGYKT